MIADTILLSPPHIVSVLEDRVEEYMRSRRYETIIMFSHMHGVHDILLSLQTRGGGHW